MLDEGEGGMGYVVVFVWEENVYLFGEGGEGAKMREVGSVEFDECRIIVVTFIGSGDYFVDRAFNCCGCGVIALWNDGSEPGALGRCAAAVDGDYIG